MKRVSSLLLLLISLASITHAQLSGTKTIGIDYPTLNAAITDLNTVGVAAGGATINVPAGYTETAPANGFVLGSAVLNASLSAGNPLTIQKNGSGANPLLTAPVGTVTITWPNYSPDGIFKLAGTDYVTIDAIDLTESAANTTAVTATEYGYMLLNLRVTAPSDGCHNNTIKNCRVTLNRLLSSRVGCIEVRHTTPTSTSLVVVSAFGDTHSYNKFYSNYLTNASIGISIYTSGNGALADQYNDIGGSSVATGNTITNLGSSDIIYGVFTEFADLNNISFNTIDQLADGGTGSLVPTLGIYFRGTNTTQTANNNIIKLQLGSLTQGKICYGINTLVAGTVAVNNNTIELTAPTAGTPVNIKGGMTGIYLQTVIFSTVSGNNITLLQNTAGIAGGIQVNCTNTSVINSNRIKVTVNKPVVEQSFDLNFCIATTGQGASETISDNILDNCSVNSDAGLWMISCRNTSPYITITNNRTEGTTTKSGTPSQFNGSVRGINAGATSNYWSLVTISNNNFSNIHLSAQHYFTGLNVYYSPPQGVDARINNNTITNITGSSAGIIMMYLRNENQTEIRNNNFSHVTAEGYVEGIYVEAAGSNLDISNNLIHTFTANGNNSSYRALKGIYQEGVMYDIFGDLVVANTKIHRNKIYNLQYNNPSGSVAGIEMASGNVDIYNNYIGDLRAPVANAVGSTIGGINIISAMASTSIRASYNTIYLDAVSSGTDFSATGIYHKSNPSATTASLTLINNIIINKSIPNGNGFVSAIRRSSDHNGNLANFNIASDNNLLYAGTPSPKNLIYSDSIFFAQTLSDYQNAVYSAGTVAPRDTRSATEASTTFLSLDGNNANFLHLDPAVATVAESGARSLTGITTDFDGNARNATTPDIGADETAGIAANTCNSAPVAGTISGPNTTCSLDSITLQLSGQSVVGNGVTVQWAYSNVPGGPYTNIPGATGLIFNTGPVPGGVRYYVAIVTCSHTGATATSSEFAVTSTAAYQWTGAINTQWENAGNWTCGIVPYGNVDVVINSGTVVVNINTWVGSLTLGPGVNFTVNPGRVFYIAHQ